jgi:SAM-dependent methyltransferase
VDINFQVIDLHKEFKSVDKCFDVVTCSEVLEHVGERTTAIRNLALLLNKGGYLILTVPRGKIFPIDQSCGHLAHFNDVEIFSKYFYIRENHQWGFPFFNLYKWAINLRPSAISRRFLNKKYSLSEKIVSEVIYFLFFLNINRFGYQQILVLEKK